ncbi:MAG: hypothetical protein K2R98_00525 [Gemmataceae bacterium]|nr:hypothetical protein [Gemmataceae bacterium]
MRSILPLAISVFLGLAAHADEAVMPNGKIITGVIRIESKGRVNFFGGKDLVHPLDEVHCLRFPATDQPPLRAGVVHRVLLRDQQQLTGELLEWKADVIRLKPIWSDRPIEVQRSAVVAVTHLPGYVSVFDDDFEGDDKAWKLAKDPRLVGDNECTSGTGSLLLSAVGQAAEYTLPAPMEAGRFGINFRDPGDTPAGRWLVEAEFVGAKDARIVAVTVVHEGESYPVQIPDAGKVKPRLERQKGWRRLSVEFTPKKLCILLDEQVLCATLEQGPGGPLRKVRLRCEQSPEGRGPPGRVWFDDFSVERAVSKPRRDVGDIKQDELVLVSGDQLFGEVIRANRRTIEVQGRFGKRSIPWSEVLAVHPRRENAAGTSTKGEHVRLWLRPGVGVEFDQLEGAIGQAGDKLELLHPALQMDRREPDPPFIHLARLHQIKGVFYGERIELDNALHHLGRNDLPASPVPQPDGLSFRTEFKLTAVEGDARLLLDASFLKGAGDGPKIAKALERGGLRTEVLLNGKVIDYLNRHVGRASSEPARLSIVLPKAQLKVGANALELRQTLDRDSGLYEDCVIGNLVLEMPR